MRIKSGLTAANVAKLTAQGVHVITTEAGMKLAVFQNPYEICSEMADAIYRLKWDRKRKPIEADLRRMRAL